MRTQDKPEPTEGFVEADAARLHYLDWGGQDNRAAVHLLHANGFCAGTYSPLVRRLVDHVHVVASDVRGHGGSDGIGAVRLRHWRIFAEDLRHVVEGVMTPPVVGVGHSLGAVTTCIAAAEYPRLFSGIVLMDPVILPMRTLWLIRFLRMFGLAGLMPLAKGARRRKQTFNGRVEAFRRFAAGRGLFKTWSDEFIDAYLECGLLEREPGSAVLRCDPEMEAQIFESVPLDVWDYVRRVRCPVLAIRGARSDAFHAGAAVKMDNVIADFRLETVPDAGHFVPMEQPEACARAILAFVERLT